MHLKLSLILQNVNSLSTLLEDLLNFIPNNNIENIESLHQSTCFEQMGPEFDCGDEKKCEWFNCQF